MRILFWLSAFGVLYPYFGYPLVLKALLWLRRAPGKTGPAAFCPPITMIIPAHNEADKIARKAANTVALDYPSGRLEVLFVDDGSTDGTADVLRQMTGANVRLVELPVRQGKAAALNAGLAAATHDIIVFSDASIELAPDALRRIVAPFEDPEIGCVSGEDRIAGADGEGLYGRYELYLRRLESTLGSIVGASGCFYAQRRSLCRPFTQAMAPDFLSVLRTVQQGARAISEPSAVGLMTSVKNVNEEFERKVRTSIRGMTTLFAHGELLNPFRYGLFAFFLWSHKILRWTVPFFMLGAFVSSAALYHVPLFAAALAAQVLFYAGALAALANWGNLHQSTAGKAVLYISTANAALLAAWYQFGRGVRQELWTP